MPTNPRDRKVDFGLGGERFVEVSVYFGEWPSQLRTAVRRSGAVASRGVRRGGLPVREPGRLAGRAASRLVIRLPGPARAARPLE
ncbi:hypothetical protein Aph02nite_67220 [Actinoplanes philippinensis]|nr:hypothetical protein Aph02nite_67220 [Actinoplanes philippinensis]